MPCLPYRHGSLSSWGRAPSGPGAGVKAWRGHLLSQLELLVPAQQTSPDTRTVFLGIFHGPLPGPLHALTSASQHLALPEARGHPPTTCAHLTALRPNRLTLVSPPLLSSPPTLSPPSLNTGRNTGCSHGFQEAPWYSSWSRQETQIKRTRDFLISLLPSPEWSGVLTPPDHSSPVIALGLDGIPF